ncbi:cation:proton antiporter domain-containing protein [Halomicrobium katesii]|uniref:cation:proton antiporter domain-containing protein n=1 Tax=Halomicrobium katesii TaxID=437163 RepID=UPI00035F3C7C|nr:cation:proton antiporter [Halomicrobium katesii]
MSGITATLTSVLAVLVVALVVRLLVRHRDRVAYASVLAAVGLGVAALGLDPGLELTADVIFLLLLPPIVFQGTIEIDVRELRDDAPLVLVLTLVGLPLAVALLGTVGTVAFGFELSVALLFAAIVLPTDPAAVLSMFEEFDVAERLAVTIEGESLLNDGVAIVVFSTLVATIQASGESVTDIATVAGLSGFAADIAVVGGGGLVIGVVVGLLAHRLVRGLSDSMSVLLVTIAVAYGSFLVVEHYLHLSGVLATVGAGLAMGAHAETHDAMSDPEHTVQEVWDTLAFLVTTVLYVLIGASVELAEFVDHAGLIALAAVLVLLVRAATIYPLVTATNRLLGDSVPTNCQHIMVWSGLHTVVPVALVLAVPDGVAAGRPLETMVFGVAVLSLVVQGLLMPAVLDLTGLAGGDADGTAG